MKIVLFLTSITTAVAAKCGSSVSISGSDVIAPIALVWKAGYAHQCPSAKVTVATGGSTKGLAAVCAGTVDIGASSRVPKSTEATKGSNGSYTCVTGGKKLTEVSIALDGLTISAKPGGAAASCIKALGGLTIPQLNTIFSNAKSAPKWSDLGSQCKAYAVPIKITGPLSSSGTASFFSDVVFTKPQTFRASYSTVANSDPKVVIKTILSDGNYVAITGYGTYVTNKSSVTAAPIKNPKNVFVLPSSTSITNGSYPFSRYLYFYALTTSIATKAKAYIDYGLSVAGSAALARTGYIALPATIIKQMLGRIGG